MGVCSRASGDKKALALFNENEKEVLKDGLGMAKHILDQHAHEITALVEEGEETNLYTIMCGIDEVMEELNDK